MPSISGLILDIIDFNFFQLFIHQPHRSFEGEATFRIINNMRNLHKRFVGNRNRRMVGNSNIELYQVAVRQEYELFLYAHPFFVDPLKIDDLFLSINNDHLFLRAELENRVLHAGNTVSGKPGLEIELAGPVLNHFLKLAILSNGFAVMIQNKIVQDSPFFAESDGIKGGFHLDCSRFPSLTGRYRNPGRHIVLGGGGRGFCQGFRLIGSIFRL